MTRSALIVVTHLLGVGHLTRAAALARGLARAGWRTTLVSGGRPAPLIDMAGVDLVQLPPVHCVGADFRTLYGPDGAPVTPAMLAERGARLRAAFDAGRPDVVVTELFPFGRKQLRAEFVALLDAAAASRPRPAILCSIRDVPNPPSEPDRAAKTLTDLGRWYDGVLVHGDDSFVPLSAAWPVDDALARQLLPTGYIHETRAVPAAGASTDVLVSGGGSSAGLPLCRAAVAAARLAPNLTWRVLCGHGIPEADVAALVATATANATVERARKDFQALLAGCRVSVSQAGYNTVLDIAAARARAVLVPFAEGGEREQTIRADALARRGAAVVVPADTLTPDALLAAITHALDGPAPDWDHLALDGVARTVAILTQAAERARALDAAWSRLDAVLAGLVARGITTPVWVRDDDATTATPALDAFLARMAARGVPVALAVVPSALQADLRPALEAVPGAAALAHGWSHTSHAPPGAKSSEYPAGRDPVVVGRELRDGWAAVRDRLGPLAVPVFVPPWNRMADAAAALLADTGLAALSGMAKQRAPGIVAGAPRLDVHWDPIDWRGTRGLADPVMLLDTLAALLAAPSAMPLGILTHHAVHDAWVDRFLDAVLERLRASGAVRFVDAREALRVASELAVEVVGAVPRPLGGG